MNGTSGGETPQGTQPPSSATPPLPAPPPLRGRRDLGLRRGWATALIRGGLAFVVMGAFGQAIAFGVYVAGDPSGVPASMFARIGWFYFGWFHRVSIEAIVPNIDLSALVAAPSAAPLVPGSPGGAAAQTGSFSFGAGIALLFATAIAIWLLYRAGRAAAEASGSDPLARILGGLKVAPVYAVPSFLVSLAVSIQVHVPFGSLAAGDLTIRSSPSEALLFPLLIAGGAGLAGGLMSAREQLVESLPWARRVFGALAGGWRMLVAGLALSFVGLLVLAVVEPDATRAYFEAVATPPADGTAVLIGHHVLLLPNQSMWVLVPAMGGCDGAYGGAVSENLLCYWRFPESVSGGFPVGSSEAISPNVSFPTPQARFGSAPPIYFLFLLVPIVSVFIGGRRAASRGSPTTSGEAALLGALAGAVFAVFVGVTSLLASMQLSYSVNFNGLHVGSAVRVGPNIVTGMLLALGWGAIGGYLGGRYEGRSLPRTNPVAAAAWSSSPRLP